MSKETQEWLNENTLIGFTAERGNAWHYRAGADNHFDGPVPIESVRKILGWYPEVVPYTYAWNGEVKTSNRISVVQPLTGDLLGVFTDGYEPHAYPEWLVDKVEVLLGDGLAVGSAGQLRKGAVAWVSVEVPETVTVPSVGEAFRPSLLATTSFDGSLATTYKRVITRVVCDNTLGAAMTEKIGEAVRVRHTRNSRGKLDVLSSRDALGIVFQMADEFAKSIEDLCARTVTDAQWTEFLKAHLGPRPDEKGRSRTMHDNKAEGLTTMYRSDARVAPWAGTAWGVVQAVNTYRHHEGIVRGAARPLRNMELAVTGEFEALDAQTIAQLDLVSVK